MVWISPHPPMLCTILLLEVELARLSSSQTFSAMHFGLLKRAIPFHSVEPWRFHRSLAQKSRTSSLNDMTRGRITFAKELEELEGMK